MRIGARESDLHGVHSILLPPRISRIRRILPIPYLGIDLGTANTRIYATGKGLIAEDPTIVQLKRDETGLPASIWGAAPERMPGCSRCALELLSISMQRQLCCIP
jgi:hypothetical protein